MAITIGDAKKNSDRIESDFYISSFDPIVCLNLENIFFDFPRLCSIMGTDCIPIEVVVIIKSLLAAFKHSSITKNI